jgi:hypothetical protein
MANTFTLIEAKTLGSAAASVTFSSIPQTYTDLKLVATGRINQGGYDASPWVSGIITLNATAITSGKLLAGTGSAAVSDSNADAFFVTDTDGTSNTFSSFDMYLPNYTSSNTKSVSVDVVTENNATAAAAILEALLSSVTSAITSITLSNQSTYTYAINSTFYLYGIKNS